MAFADARFLDDFTVQLLHLATKKPKHLSSILREPVLLSSMGGRVAGWAGFQPSISFHAFEQRIKRAWTNAVSMSPKFFSNPLTVDGTFSRMVEDVDLPEAEKYLPCHQIRRRRTGVFRVGLRSAHRFLPSSRTGAAKFSHGLNRPYKHKHTEPKDQNADNAGKRVFGNSLQHCRAKKRTNQPPDRAQCNQAGIREHFTSGGG
jgi:hypothetical protein